MKAFAEFVSYVVPPIWSGHSHACMYVRMYVRMYVYVCIYVCMHVCMYVRMYVCMHVSGCLCLCFCVQNVEFCATPVIVCCSMIMINHIPYPGCHETRLVIPVPAP